MSETQNSKPESKKKDGIYVFIIILLIAALGALGLLIANKNKNLNQCSIEKASLESDMAGMEDMMGQYVGSEKGNIKEDLRSMLEMYDDQLLKNNANKDSIQFQKDKITSLIQELDNNKKSSARQIYKYKKESETLRKIMKGYIQTIDSLNTLNVGLRTDLETTNKTLTNVSTERDELKEKTTKLESKVAAGARLNAFNIYTSGMKYKLDGSLKENETAGKVAKVRSCFTIGENAIAQSGTKNIYLQVITPDGKVLYQRSSNVINIDGANILYSDKKEIDYQNQSIDVCVYYDTNGADLVKGNYVVKLYADGAVIGKDSF
ncbi:MAG: hypothetical protein ABI207_08030, partial [Crocinitomicaceae bacterium]